MKEELLKQFTEKLLHYANSAEMFANKNIPLYIEELLKFKMYENLASFVLLAITAVFLFGLAAYTTKRFMSTNNLDDGGVALIGTMVLCALTISSFSYTDLMTVVKIQMAPRVYVIDYLKGKK